MGSYTFMGGSEAQAALTSYLLGYIKGGVNVMETSVA